MKEITMADVALRAGVSKSTVSHVINNTRFVEKDTRQRVLLAIEELNYRPSAIARSLFSKQTMTAGLLISDVGNPFYHQVILGVEDVALEHNYSVFLFNASYDLDRSKKYIHSMIDRRVDGVLFMSSSMSVELAEELTKHNIPSVVLDWEDFPIQGKVGTIKVDFETGINEAVNYLVELGHKRFAHVSGPLDLWTARERRDIFLNALEMNDIDSTQCIIVEGNLRVDGGRRTLSKMLATSPFPTAVFAANDLTALGILWEARNRGLQVPKNLSIVGLDDIELTKQTTPSITTVALPRYKIGSMAMKILLDLIQSDEESQMNDGTFHRKVSTKLVVRQSATQPIKSTPESK
jgi:DNA-binding LacI/PurR family transcriptional regulator